MTRKSDPDALFHLIRERLSETGVNKTALLRELEKYRLAKIAAEPGDTDEDILKSYMNGLLAHRVGKFCSMEFFEYLNERSKVVGNDFSDEDPMMESFSLTANTFREISDYLTHSKDRRSLFRRVLDAFSSESASIQRVLSQVPLHHQCVAYAKALRVYERSLPQFWHDLSPMEFEREVARVFSEIGYHSDQTGQPGDGGVDVMVRGKDGRKIAVQCKHHARPIGPAPVRELVGAIVIHNAALGIVVSATGFSEKAYETARSQDQILLLDLDDLIQLRSSPATFRLSPPS